MAGRNFVIAGTAAAVMLGGCSSEQANENQSFHKERTYPAGYLLDLDVDIPPYDKMLHFGNLAISASDIGEEVTTLDEICEVYPAYDPVVFGKGVHSIDTDVAKEIVDGVDAVLDYDTESDGAGDVVSSKGQAYDGDSVMVEVTYHKGQPDLLYLDIISNGVSSGRGVDVEAAANNNYEYIENKAGAQTAMMLQKKHQCRDKEQWVVSLSQPDGSSYLSDLDTADELSGFLNRFNGVRLRDADRTPHHINRAIRDPSGHQAEQY